VPECGSKSKDMEALEALRREGRERLYPSLTNPNWLVLRRRREIFQKWISRLDAGALTVLDVGGRVQPYRPLLEGKIRSYVAIDLCQTPLIGVVAGAEQIPFKSAQFDLVICTQVLEYVPNPAAAIAEIHRVLRPGGVLLLSVPSIFPRDSDRDAWRFLPASLRILLRSFRRIEIASEGGSLSGISRTFAVFLVMLSRPSLVARILQFTVIPILNVATFLLESLFPNSNDQFAANYSILAEK
jgi:SAM-dependent methyltransferase